VSGNSSDKGLIMPSLIWLAIIAATLLGAVMKGTDWASILPFCAIASVPALMTLILTPVLKREWAQLLVIFSWLGLGIAACIAFGFYPLAILFLCAPAMAALFEREKVVEALVMAFLLGGVIFLAGQMERLPDMALAAETKSWAKQSGILATLGLFIATLFGATTRQSPQGGGSDSPLDDCYLEAVDGLFLRFDAKEKLIAANRESRELLGLEKPVGKFSLGSLFSNDTVGKLSAAWSSARRDGEKHPVSFLVDSGKSKNVPIQAKLTALGDGGFALSGHNVSALAGQGAKPGAENALDIGDKSLFFAGVSHELRTPLNAIIGFSDMMRSRLFGPLPGKYAEYADLIHDSGQHMLDLIGDVLDLSKVEAGKYELHYDNFDAADVIRSSVKMIRPTADASEVSLRMDLDESETLLMEADRKALRQIILNLLSNAIKYSNKGGEIVISAKSLAGILNLSVQDKGVGMSSEDLANIGKPFTQGASAQKIDDRGSGLGLSLVKSLAELHGGRFAIASQADIGTTVDIFIPMDRKTQS